jgi:hypothetical protein
LSTTDEIKHETSPGTIELPEEAEAEVLEWEYVPGHRWVDRDGVEHWFVQSGVIKPTYVKTYLAEGGEVLRRRVGQWEEVDGTTQALPADQDTP